MKRIVIAGIGNIFLGDDGFGVKVVEELLRRSQPAGVSVVDFGIRSYDLAFALAAGYDAIILVDAAARGETPGTVSLIQPDISRARELDGEAVNAHSLNVAAVLQMAQSLGGRIGKVYLVGCEPSNLTESDTGDFVLSPPVEAAVPAAIQMVGSLVSELLKEKADVNDLVLT